MNLGAMKYAVLGLASVALLPWPESCRGISGGRKPARDTRVGSALLAPEPADPIRMEALDERAKSPMFVLRGKPRGAGHLVFLHGMCGHGLGYAQAFQFSAARYGTLIAPQGDVSCGGPWSKWSLDLDALDSRILEAFRALGEQAPIEDITVLGYSQGASRAEALARKWPKRYTRLVLMGAPTATRARGLTELRAVVTMAGERDRRDLMRASAAALLAAGVPAVFHVIPEATHGAMGPTPERTMGAALEWLYANSRAAPGADEPR